MVLGSRMVPRWALPQPPPLETDTGLWGTGLGPLAQDAPALLKPVQHLSHLPSCTWAVLGLWGGDGEEETEPGALSGIRTPVVRSSLSPLC